MTQSHSDWIGTGRGRPPQIEWSAALEGSLVALDTADETRWTYAADDSGGVAAFNARGQMQTVSRGFSKIRHLSWSAVGTEGVVCTAERQLHWLNSNLRPDWSRPLSARASGLAISPFADVAVVGLENHHNYVVQRDQTQLSEFNSVRPLSQIAFLAQRPEFIAASADGVICRFNLQGKMLWKLDLMCNVGDLAVSGDGNTILLATFQHGVTILDGRGGRQGSFLVSGAAHRVDTGFAGKLLLLSTMDHDVCLLDIEGDPRWDARTPHPLQAIRTWPLENGAVFGCQCGRIECVSWDPN